jgi:hypothetical protein
VSNWQDLVSASLIGTERAVVPRIEIPGLPLSAAATPDAAAVLLDRAALLTAARRAGRRPGRAEPLPMAAPDPRPAMSPAAGRRLARMLDGEHPGLLPEWLAEAAARGLRPPPQLLPPLLDRVRHPGTISRLVAEVGGARARWLAWLNPAWQSVLVDAPAADAWRVGTSTDRYRYLVALRGRDPGAARDLVAASWDSADPVERDMFLRALEDTLGPADEPLLEAALDDRAEQVREHAASLLAGLPGSALGRRMAERAVRCLRMEHGKDGPRLVVLPPAGPDAAMRRDGITAPPAARRPQPADRTDLALEIIGRAPLGTWTKTFGLTAARIVAIPAGGWAPQLFAGWSRAAIAQHDQEWMTALINQAVTTRPARTAVTDALRQLARHVNPRLAAPGALPGPDPGAPPAVRDALGMLRFRYEMLKELEDDHGDG